MNIPSLSTVDVGMILIQRSTFSHISSEATADALKRNIFQLSKDALGKFKGLMYHARKQNRAAVEWGWNKDSSPVAVTSTKYETHANKNTQSEAHD